MSKRHRRDNRAILSNPNSGSFAIRTCSFYKLYIMWISWWHSGKIFSASLELCRLCISYVCSSMHGVLEYSVVGLAFNGTVNKFRRYSGIPRLPYTFDRHWYNNRLCRTLSRTAHWPISPLRIQSKLFSMLVLACWDCCWWVWECLGG